MRLAGLARLIEMVRRSSARASSAFVVGLALAVSPVAGDEPAFGGALARANQQYLLRAAGAEGAAARTGPVEEAITGYRTALSLRPESNEARWRLLRALFFRASFCGALPDERKTLLEEARRIADEGVARLASAVAGRQGEARLAALREIPAAGELCYWAAVAWGEWALGRSRLAAARAGAPGRIRDLAQTVIDLDPALEEGGGHRLLGRLHDQSPRVPFVSGFVSRAKALAHLRQAYAAFPDNTVNQVFLAEALLRHDPAQREEALRLLERCASVEPRAEYLVEDRHFADLARRLLRGQVLH